MKPNVIFIEGCQGSGKSTVGRILREELSNITLLDLTGMKDKTETGEYKTFLYHHNILDMINSSSGLEANFVSVRSVMSEKIYCSLGYKPYDFQRYYDILIKYLNDLTNFYNVYFIILTVNESQLETRLKRDKFEYNKFSIENSINQQKEYLKELENIDKETNNINCYIVENCELRETIEEIKRIIKGVR